MARYRGPRRRVVRRLNIALSGLTRDMPGERKPYPPGEHGPKVRRLRLSDYGVRLYEKQKLQFYYGLSETQLRRMVTRARRMAGPTGTNLLRVLEQRLDNVVFRLGFAPTIPAARQLVTHGHILLNGERADVPARDVSPGDEIRVRESSKGHVLIAEGASRGPELALPSYLKRYDDGFGGKVTGYPVREDVPVDVSETLVTEYYAA
jgi:small subunit ribosomal protein S4